MNYYPPATATTTTEEKKNPKYAYSNKHTQAKLNHYNINSKIINKKNSKINIMR